jgi:Tfp pilus assembly protein PilF
MWPIYKSRLFLCVVVLLLGGCATTVEQSQSAGGAAVDAVPEQIQQAFDTALANVTSGDDAAAIRQLEAFIEQYPNYSAAYVNLAIVYERQKQPEQALWLLNKAIDVDPAAVEAMNHLGAISRRQGDFAAAEAHWRRATAADPTYPYAWYNLGVLCELYKQDFPAALENYRRYQALTNSADADPVVARWIEDLERRGDVPVQAANAAEAL